mgnify:CR=1 FL=1
MTFTRQEASVFGLWMMHGMDYWIDLTKANPYYQIKSQRLQFICTVVCKPVLKNPECMPLIVTRNEGHICEKVWNGIDKVFSVLEVGGINHAGPNNA